MESSASAGRVASAVLDPRRWWVLALLCGAFFMVPPDGVWVVMAEKSTDMADLLVSKQDPDVAVDRHRGDGAGGGDFGHGEGLGQTDKPSERVINLDPGAWYQTPTPAPMGEGNHADVWAAVHDPAVVHGMCEDYRAGLRADRAHEGGGRPADRQIDCPALLLNATDDDIDIHGGPKRIWEPRVAGPSSSAASRSGHQEAEQAPDELTGALRDFLVTPMQPASQP
jgi:haloacetate dehalogenase